MAEITVPDAQKRYTQDQILDVREGFEVAEDMIPGALHIPMGQLDSATLIRTGPLLSCAVAVTAVRRWPMPSTRRGTQPIPWPAG